MFNNWGRSVPVKRSSAAKCLRLLRDLPQYKISKNRRICHQCASVPAGNGFVFSVPRGQDPKKSKKSAYLSRRTIHWILKRAQCHALRPDWVRFASLNSRKPKSRKIGASVTPPRAQSYASQIGFVSQNRQLRAPTVRKNRTICPAPLSPTPGRSSKLECSLTMQSALDQIVERLQTALGDQLVSVVLYGSAATGDEQKGYSDLNVLCVLREITPRELAHVSPVFRWWRGLGNPAPLLLTRQEFQNSTDCFAIEFHDIRDHHRVLFGEPVVDELQVDDSFYRAQVEHELRAKLLRLRHKAVGVIGDRQLLCRLLADSLSTFCVLFRHALILHGALLDGAVPPGKRDVVAKAAEHFHLSAEPFERLFDLRDGKPAGRDVDLEKLLADYMMQISAVIDAVDRL